jgi:hypothetical protein
MAFFTSDYDEIALSTAWEMQLKTMRAKRLQHQNDLLFTVVRDDIFSRRAEIHAALMTVARTSLTPNGLSVPLWTYKTAHYVKPFREIVGTQEFLDTEQVIRRTGGEWFVGIRRSDEHPLDRFHEDGWDSIWRWRPVATVDEVVRHTDFMNRIALLFGDHHYRVSKEVVRRTVLDEPLEVVVEEVELTLHYFPRGVYRNVRDALQRTKDKYETHAPAELPWALRPYVWTGAGDVDPPSPIPHDVPASPPPVARRSNGGGILNPEDEVNRRLDFSIQTYEGEDAFECAARDCVAHLIRSEADGSLRAYPRTGCYCGYDHEDSEEE